MHINTFEYKDFDILLVQLKEDIIILYSQEFAPIDDELAAYRRGEEWDANRAKEEARLKVIVQISFLPFLNKLS